MIKIIETARKKRLEREHKAEVELWYNRKGMPVDYDRSKQRVLRDAEDKFRTGKARFTIEMPKKLSDEAAARAQKEGMTKNQWISFVVRLMLREAHFFLTEDQMDSIKGIADREKSSFNQACQNIVQRGLNSFMRSRVG